MSSPTLNPIMATPMTEPTRCSGTESVIRASPRVQTAVPDTPLRSISSAHLTRSSRAMTHCSTRLMTIAVKEAVSIIKTSAPIMKRRAKMRGSLRPVKREPIQAIGGAATMRPAA